MGYSIQENLKKINSLLSKTDCISLFITAVILVLLSSFLYIKKETNNIPITYTKYSGEISTIKAINTKPFASINGKTYTFSWCGGSNSISEKNIIYFENEEYAKESGRVLSKLCQK